MKFVPRFTRPEANNKYYITVGRGGYSYAIQGYPTDPYCDVLSNCVGYAYGRFNEIGGYGQCKYLAAVNAENFIQYAGECKVGQVPKLGACMVWRKGATLYPDDGPGHVAIVEQVVSSTEVITSESGWGYTTPFLNETRSKGDDGRWGMGTSYTFLGFIYNPACDDLDEERSPISQMLIEAESHIGEGPSWTYSHSKAVVGLPWSAAFVCAVVNSVAALDRVLPMSCSATDIGKLSVSDYGGKWIPGPAQGGKANPQPGDIVLIRTKSGTRSSVYDSDRAGIVTDVQGDTVYTVQGDVSGKVGQVLYSTSSSNTSSSIGVISGYIRPNWKAVSASIQDVPSFTPPLYDSTTTEKDATLRQVGYINRSYQPSILPSDIKLSVINYTSMLSTFYQIFTQSGSSDSPAANLSKLDSLPRTILYYLFTRGLSRVCSISLLAYMITISKLDTGNTGKLYGICRWTGSRALVMIQVAGSDWNNNLSGQLDYLCVELRTSTYVPLQEFLSYSDDLNGLSACAQLVATTYNPSVPVDVDACQASSIAIWRTIYES